MHKFWVGTEAMHYENINCISAYANAVSHITWTIATDRHCQ